MTRFDTLAAYTDVYLRAVHPAEPYEPPGSILTGFRRPYGWAWSLPCEQISLIVGHAGTGKTGLALSVARHVACEADRPTLFLSAELPVGLAATRLISGLTGATMRTLRHAELMSGKRLTKVQRGLARLKTAPLMLVGDGPTALDDLNDLMCHERVDLLVIDGLSLLRPSDSVGALIGELRRLTLGTGAAVLATLTLPMAPGPPTLSGVEAAGVDLAAVGAVIGLSIGGGHQAQDLLRNERLKLEARFLKDRTTPSGDALCLEWDARLVEPRPRDPTIPPRAAGDALDPES